MQGERSALDGCRDRNGGDGTIRRYLRERGKFALVLAHRAVVTREVQGGRDDNEVVIEIDRIGGSIRKGPFVENVDVTGCGGSCHLGLSGSIFIVVIEYGAG